MITFGLGILTGLFLGPFALAVVLLIEDRLVNGKSK
jgi:hypothetical protein